MLHYSAHSTLLYRSDALSTNLFVIHQLEVTNGKMVVSMHMSKANDERTIKGSISSLSLALVKLAFQIIRLVKCCG